MLPNLSRKKKIHCFGNFQKFQNSCENVAPSKAPRSERSTISPWKYPSRCHHHFLHLPLLTPIRRVCARWRAPTCKGRRGVATPVPDAALRVPATECVFHGDVSSGKWLHCKIQRPGANSTSLGEYPRTRVYDFHRKTCFGDGLVGLSISARVHYVVITKINNFFRQKQRQRFPLVCSAGAS